MNHSEHLNLALQELAAKRVSPFTDARMRRILRVKNRAVRKKLRAKRRANQQLRKWMPLGYLWLLKKGFAVRPPQYYRGLEKFGLRFVAMLINSWPFLWLALFWVTVPGFDPDQTLQSELILFATIYFSGLALLVVGTLFGTAWHRRKYQLSTWEELADGALNKSQASASDSDQNPTSVRGGTVLE